MRRRIREACVHLPQCGRCRGVTRWTYLATHDSHPLPVGVTAKLCLECWGETRREDQR
jgi:hypothetical protein